MFLYIHFSRRKEFEEKKEKGVLNVRKKGKEIKKKI